MAAKHLRVGEGKVWWGEQVVGEEGKVTVAPGDVLGKHLPEAVRYNLAPVPGGDALIPTVHGVVGVERKAASDAINSWISGHLAEQLGIMLGNYDHTILCLEDTQADRLYSQFSWLENPAQAYQRWQDDLLTFQEEGVRMWYTLSVEGTAAAVTHLMQRYNRERHHALYVLRTSPYNPQMRMLIAPPGWGVETAESAMKYVGPPIEVFNAEERRLEKVPLVTPRKIRLLFDAIGRIRGKRNDGKNRR